jgi:hypothetical protein
MVTAIDEINFKTLVSLRQIRQCQERLLRDETKLVGRGYVLGVL